MTRDELSKLIARQPRAVLTHVPTPLEQWDDLLVKRDDLTGLGFGGSKLRMLEVFLGIALQQGAKILVTAGPPQSNYCRLTAAACARYGLQCRLLIIGSQERDPGLSGNRLLNRLLGAEMVPVNRASAREEIAAYVARLQHEGVPFYFIDGGGHTPAALWGYLGASVELLGQLEAARRTPQRLFLACARGTTQAGLLLGLRLLGCPIPITGVSAARERERCRSEIREIITGFCQQYELKNPVTESDIEVDDQWIGPGYDVVPEERWRIIATQARERGLLLDPIYTSRAMQGLLDYVRTTNSRNALLVHTGGGPGLFDPGLQSHLASVL